MVNGSVRCTFELYGSCTRDVAKYERSVRVARGDDVNVFVNGVCRLSLNIKTKISANFEIKKIIVA